MSQRQAIAVRPDDISSIRIGLASPEMIRSWSSGEVRHPDTLNYRTSKPVEGGLFCERIFGSEKEWECRCGKYKGIRYKDLTCDRCGVKVESGQARRQRMGHIELAVPVVHLWYFKLRPNCLSQLFGLKNKELAQIIYYQTHVVLDPGKTELGHYQLLDDYQLRQTRERCGDHFEAGTGAEAIHRMLSSLNLTRLARRLRVELNTLLNPRGSKRRVGQERLRKLIHRLRTVEGLLHSENQPEWMVLTCLPVLPVDLRPIVRLSSGVFASSDLNDLYRRVLQRNNRLRKLIDMQAPEVILRCEKRLLQQAVDSLFDNSRCAHPARGGNGQPLKSLADLLKGKEGRFRQNLLGKRVDYSGRSVIVVGPGLKLHQCGLPKKIALELYQPFVLRELLAEGVCSTVRQAKKQVLTRDEHVWDALARAMQGHPVLLNRAPTLHRMGIQAFEPLLVEGNAIQLHPLVCKAFNADFDGDQMAVHLPLSVQAQAEARNLLMSTRNIFNPANGQPIVTPSQDMVLGCYYLTAPPGKKEELRTFHSVVEVLQALDAEKVGIHDSVRLRLPMKKRVFAECDTPNGLVIREVERVGTSLVNTTCGRVVFNDSLPTGLPFYDVPLTSKNLSRIIADCQGLLGREATVGVLEAIKTMGFSWATRSGLSFASSDLHRSAGKQALIDVTQRKVDQAWKQYEQGNVTDDERMSRVLGLWSEVTAQVGQEVLDGLAQNQQPGTSALNPVYVMLSSGARGNREQVRQLAGMRGLMARPSGSIIETPITSSFREGLSVREYFTSTHGARKGLADTALKTADSGYLTRKLVDVAQHVVVREVDCGTHAGTVKRALSRQDSPPRPLSATVIGRVSCEEVLAPSGEVLVRAGECITPRQGARLDQEGIAEVRVRSPLTCASERGVCAKCYGTDLATGEPAQQGLAVGIVAAQSIGEPATQLTLRTFHTGGAAHVPDITTGLPRVCALFEAHRPARPALLAEVSGVVRISEEEEKYRGRQVMFVQPVNEVGEPLGERHQHLVEAGASWCVMNGQPIEVGMPLTHGEPTSQDLLRTQGLEAAQQYVLDELQAVYRRQGVDLNDKHLEVILAQMFRRVEVVSPGDTTLLPGARVERRVLEEANQHVQGLRAIRLVGDSRFAPGTIVNREELREECARLRAIGAELPRGRALQPATCRPVLLGISQTALLASGFLSAASFQETTRVLAEAAVAGKVDELNGLKENVLLGRLIPAGTGFSPR